MTITIRDKSDEPTASALGQINQLFHSQYSAQKKHLREKIIAGEYLLFVRMDDRLIKLKGEDIEQFGINGDEYHKMKAACHLPVAVFFLLSHANSKEKIEQVTELLSQLDQETQPKPVAQMIEIVGSWLAELEDYTNLAYSSISTLARQLEPLFAKLLSHAAHEEIKATVTLLNSIHKQHQTPASHVFLLTIGGHQPRYKQLATLIFKKWYSQLEAHLTNVEHHVMYCEKGESVDDAIDLLVTRLADGEIGQLFLGSTDALNQDVLGVVAEQQIERYWSESEIS